MRIMAPAKINPFLSVGPRRADGKHEILSVMQSIDLADELGIEPDVGIALSMETATAAPAGEDNLALRAARALAAATGARAGARLSLLKRIPVAAGLAGGSADAAAALVGLNELWGTALSRKALEQVGAGIGADVPFCVRGGTAVARGVGEVLAPLVCPPLWWVLGVADAPLPTAEVYEAFDRLGGPGLEEPADLASALARKEVGDAARFLRNDLEPAAAALRPETAAGRDALMEAGALGAVMSGSGPAWIGLARDEAHARAVAASAAAAFPRIEVARSLDRGARIVSR